MLCPYCGREAAWVENKVIYGHNYGKSYMVYYCVFCDAHVGCHNNTQTPMGTMANHELRAARVRAHSAIDPMWKSGLLTRDEVYNILNNYFGKEVHIGFADLEMCNQIIEFAEKKWKRKPIDYGERTVHQYS